MQANDAGWRRVGDVWDTCVQAEERGVRETHQRDEVRQQDASAGSSSDGDPAATRQRLRQAAGAGCWSESLCRESMQGRHGGSPQQTTVRQLLSSHVANVAHVAAASFVGYSVVRQPWCVSHGGF